MASLSELHHEVRWAIEDGDLPHARRICGQVLAARPDNLQTILLLAEVDLEEHRYRAASTGFERVLQGDPESYLAYAGLGIVFASLNHPARAVSWYSRALDLDPANAEIRRERDRLFAQAYPDRVLPSGLSRFALGRSLFQSGFRDEGVAHFQSAIARHPNRLEIRLTLAEALWAMAKSGAAQQLCQQIVQSAPRVVKANALLACIAAEMGEVERGRELLADVHAQDPEGFIAGDIIRQSPLADLATIPIDIPREGPAIDRAAADTPRHDATLAAPWVRWMRDALWSALRLIKPAVEEVVASRAAWARIAPAGGEQPGASLGAEAEPARGAEQPSAALKRTRPSAPTRDDDQTEVIYPGAARRRHRPKGRR